MATEEEITENEETTETVETKKAINELKERIDRLTSLVEKGKGEVEEYTKANPLVALGAAFLVGIATGAIVVAVVSSRK